MKPAIAAVPAPQKKRRERIETRAAEARLFRFFRAVFRELDGGQTTWKDRQQLREDARREVNRYFDAKVAGR